MQIGAPGGCLEKEDQWRVGRREASDLRAESNRVISEYHQLIIHYSFAAGHHVWSGN